MKKSSYPILLLVIVVSLLSFFAGKSSHSLKEEGEDTNVRQSGFTFINPLLECENNDSFAKQKYLPFEKNLKREIENNITKNHSGVLLSVYFRNLNNGPWFGIRENEKYIPASLMKLTLLISYLKWWEEAPDLLDRKILVDENNPMNQLVAPKKKLEIGKEYTIRDLLYYLIVYSDNNASRELFEYIPLERQNKTFTDLGITPPDVDPNYGLSVKEYASFFRMLYNASYVSDYTSEEALSILAASTYENGLRKGVGKDIAVAHKFGEREIIYENGSTTNQLHDCGIVYHPTYPYLICIMTRGNLPLSDLTTAISSTSTLIYDKINTLYPIPQKNSK